MIKVMGKKYHLIFFGLIIIVALILRFYKLGFNPPSINWDEASIGYNAYSILQTGKDEYGNLFPLSFRSFDDYKPPLYIYLTVFSVALFGLTEFAVRFPAALFGVFAVISVYYLIRLLFYKNPNHNTEYLALTGALFFAVSPWHLQFSRAAYEGNLGLFFLILSLAFFLKGLRRGRYYLLYAVMSVFCMYSYHSFRLVCPILVIIMTILFRKEIIKNKIIYIFSILLIIILTIPIYLSFFNAQGTQSRLSMVTIFSNPEKQMEAAIKTQKAKEQGDILGQIIFNRRFIFIPDVLKGFSDHFNPEYLFIKGDGGVQHHAVNMGMLYLWDFPFLICGIIILLRKMNRRIFLLFAVFLISVLPSSITTGTPHPVRAIGMMLGFHIFTAVGLLSVVKILMKNKSKLKMILIVIISIIYIVNFIYYLLQYYKETPKVYGYFWQYGNKEAIKYAKVNENKFNKIYMSYMYDQPYIYYLFYNRINPSWYQGIWNYKNTGEVDRFYRKIGKYEFKKIDYAVDSQEKKILIIASPPELPENIVPVHTIYFLDGKIAYKIIAL